MHDLDIDILCITETWLSDNDIPIISSLNTKSLRFTHLPRPGPNYGGGIGVLYRNNIKLIHSSDLHLDHSEAFKCTFHPVNSLPFTLITIYRPPHNSTSSFIDEIDNIMSSLTNQSILLGDINIPLSSSSLYSKRFLHAIESNNCSQYVNSPTHTSGNILDLIIALNTPNIILNTSVISLVTDHLIITFNLQFPRSKRLTKTIQFRKTKNITITDFTNDLMSHLSTFADYPDINSLDSSLLKTLNRLAPTLTKTITPRLNTKWFNRNLSLTKRQLRYTEKKWRKHKSEENLTSFKQLSSKYRQLIKKAKREYYTDTITAAGNNAKKLYQISNSLLGSTTPRILPDCPASTNSANFDNYFNNKIINIINSLPSPTLPSLLTPSYSLNSFKTPSIASINNLLLSVKSVCMLDPIPLILLNKLTTLLSPLYKQIIDLSLISGKVPAHMKNAHVTPILKKNNPHDKSDLSNYRPISNLSYISKTLERIVSSQLHDYLDNNNILNQFQSAYTTYKSTETALTHVLNNILLHPTKHCSIIIFLDLSAAFDTIDHSLLIRRLQCIGITGTALDWFTSYLESRTYSVCIDSYKTKPRIISHGVPQGSVLAPILFNIYLAPLLDIFDRYPEIHFHTYADDIQVYCSLPDPSTNISILNNCLDEISGWLASNSLSLNTNKTTVLLIKSPTTSTNIPSIRINNQIIKYSSTAQNLGIILDQKLSFSQYTTSLSKSINRTLHTIRLIRPSITTKLAQLLVTSLILPRIDYCNSTLHRLPRNSIIPFTKLLYSAARIVYRIPKYSRTHITPYLRILHWLPITQRIQYKIMLLTHLATHHNKPDYLTDLLTDYNPSRSQRTENQYKLHTHNCTNLTIKQQSAFSIAAPKLWNSLPTSLRSLSSTPSFKRKLKTYLFSFAYQ